MIDFCGDLLWKGNESLKMRMTYWYILESFPHGGRVPYSSIPTRHRICLDNGTEIYSMCAIDTFYVPYLTDCDLTIHSHCFFCRSDIEVVIEQKSILKATPADSMIWNSTAPYTCPMTNFFCSEEHLLKWRKKNPDEPGQVFTQADSLERGKNAVERIKQSREGLNRILCAKADDIVCYCRNVPKAAIVTAINTGILSLEGITKETAACTGDWCEDMNPEGRCCSVEIKALIEAYSEY
jgi:hypothetical protein